ncbi:MAG: tRNA epoxyqueuosine(34) reductase QueG, partial [Bacteroidia bacterium]|nr:tRNA epoxyqueuosine(34) reductase QueG [Bacteroidia bacterium]
MHKSQSNSAIIKKLSIDFGFDFCGISKATFLENEASKLEKWLSNGFNGSMQYLENHFDKRLDPTLLVPGAKTVVSLMVNYYPSTSQISDSYKIAKYAYGEDYHSVVKDKCNNLLNAMRDKIGLIEGRVFVDSAPILERTWAEKSGLGWIGKHGLLINKQKGSFFFLAELVIDLECEPDGPIKDYCGTCTKCVDACPTEAILPNKTLDANKCISYLTIELKEQIPQKFENQMNDWIFGCDICQEVCPWNRFAKPTLEPRFKPILSAQLINSISNSMT